MRTLTPEQCDAVEAARERWTEWIFSTAPADRKQAEEGVRLTCRTACVPEPEIFLWCDDLREALLVTEQLADFRHSNWMLPPEGFRLREDARRKVRTALGLPTWKEVVRVIGPWHSPHRHVERLRNGVTFRVAVRRTDSLQAGLPTIADDPSGDCEAIEEAARTVGRAALKSYQELQTIVQHSAEPGPPGHFAIGWVPPVYDSYRLDLLFRHDCLMSILGEQASERYRGLCLTVQHCGPWWAYAKAAVMCDRPRVMHRDREGRVHHESEPALVLRNGLELFAWHGSWVPEEAIRNPESPIQPMIQVGKDPGVRAALVDIYGAERFEREYKPPRVGLTANALSHTLPDSLNDKIVELRTFGRLPRYERYLAGEHRQVWQELAGLGERVREPGYSADALAVAYTTMTRVRQNLATIVARLPELGYAFSAQNPEPLMPPEMSRAKLRSLEEDAGLLPLSLRIWYEVVGSVTLLGKQPLIVVPFSQIVRQWDQSPPDVGLDGRPFVAEVVPPYGITLPSYGMDALLENEPNGLTFVDYLRQALECGAFPGFQSATERPKEIGFLTDGLLPF